MPSMRRDQEAAAVKRSLPTDRALGCGGNLRSNITQLSRQRGRCFNTQSLDDLSNLVGLPTAVEFCCGHEFIR